MLTEDQIKERIDFYRSMTRKALNDSIYYLTKGSFQGILQVLEQAVLCNEYQHKIQAYIDVLSPSAKTDLLMSTLNWRDTDGEVKSKE